MRYFALVVVFLAFVVCLPAQETSRSLEARIAFQQIAANQAAQENTRPMTTGIIFQSSDGGDTWQDISAGLPKDLLAWSFFAEKGETFLGSYAGLYRSAKSPLAQAWNKEDFPVEGITGIFSGKTGPYVISFGNGFYQETPGTGDWRPMHGTLIDKRVHTVVETPDGTIYASCDSGIFKTTDGGKSWRHVFSEGIVTNLVTANGVLIGCGLQGLLRSTDAGEHWEYVLTEDGKAKTTEYMDGRFMAITRNGGTYKEVIDDPEGMANRLRTSTDGGKTWLRMDEPLSKARILNSTGESLKPVWGINDIKQAGKHLFCSLDTGVFRSSDMGKTWELVRPANGKTLVKLVVAGGVIFALQIEGC